MKVQKKSLKSVVSYFAEMDLSANGLIDLQLGQICQNIPPSKRNRRIDIILATKPEFLQKQADIKWEDKTISTTYILDDMQLGRLKYLGLHPQFITQEILYCLGWIFDWCFPQDYSITTTRFETIKKNPDASKMNRASVVELKKIQKHFKKMGLSLDAPPLSILLKIESVKTADKVKLKIAIEEMVKKALSEARSKLSCEEIISRMIHAGHIDYTCTPLVAKGKLYAIVRQIIKGNIKFCKYCEQDIKEWSHSNRITYHPDCRSNRSHRLKKMKGREAILTDGKRVEIIDAKRGTFVVKHRLSGTTFEVSDRRSSRDDLPVIESYKK